MKAGHIDTLLRTLVVKGASDLHLQAGSPPIFRVFGQLHYSDLEPMSDRDVEEYAIAVMSPEQADRFKKNHSVDLSYEVLGVARFRVNLFKQKGHVGASIRVIPFEIKTMDELGIPGVVKDLAQKPNGLIVVTGPAGSGKSTSLASIINYINETRKAHIITIEEPLEFIHKNKECMINQREVGQDTPSFSQAIVDSLREDPDVILVGEIRDLDTISNAITAAETGHLVFATLHTNSAAQAIDRMIDVFPPHQQFQVRTQLSTCLQGVIAQVLLRRKDGQGRVAVFETMVANSAVRNLIKESKSQQIENAIQTGQQDGMKLMRDSLKEMVLAGVITMEDALTKVSDMKTFQNSLLMSKPLLRR